MNNVKKWYQSKTLWVARFVSTVGIAYSYAIFTAIKDHESDIRDALIPLFGTYTGFIITGLGIIFEVLRFMTTKGIGNDER